MIGHTAANVRLKHVALPVEHGAWAFLIEPIVLSLLVVPSLAAGWLSLSAVGIFLVRHPLKLVLKDWLKRKRYARTLWAERFAAVYAAIGVVGFILAVLTAEASFVIPLLMALPFAIIQLRYDLLKRGREVVPELAGAVAPGALAAASALAAGWSLATGLTLWLLIGMRAAISILYVRARLRPDSDLASRPQSALIAHGLALLVTGVLAIGGVAPWLAAAAMFILLARAEAGLTRHKPTATRNLGVQEVIFGLVTVTLIALGYRLPL